MFALWLLLLLLSLWLFYVEYLRFRHVHLCWFPHPPGFPHVEVSFAEADPVACRLRITHWCSATCHRDAGASDGTVPVVGGTGAHEAFQGRGAR